MNTFRIRVTCIGAALCWSLVAASSALAATSFSNSLTGFTGDSTMAGTQADLAAAGFNFFSTSGLDLDNMLDPTVTFDSTGAKFGSFWGGDGGRNYIRTNDSDYATVDFVAEVTVERNNAISQQVFIGMGAGDTALFGVPDWSTLFSSTFTSPEDGSLTTWRSANDANEWISGPAVPAVGTHRVRMEFDSTAKMMTYSMDVDYAGGDFVADVTAPPTNLVHIDCPVGCGFPEMPISADFFAADGWPSEPSRIFFGGDDSTIFRDFSVTVSAPPALLGDYNDDGSIDAADYVVWRDLNGTAGPLTNDPTPGAVDSNDYDYWVAHFGQSAGGGSVAAHSAVPEPSALALVACGVAALAFALKRAET